jgi:DNA transformation protein and related proteins
MADDTVFFKMDDSNRADFERTGSRSFRPYGEDMYAMSYYELPADVLENRQVLCQWAEKAVAVARRSATAKGR